MSLTPALISDLPRHPRTGLQAIGLWRDGRPIWPVMGASEDNGAGQGGQGGQNGQQDNQQGAQDGQGGQQAGGKGDQSGDQQADRDAQGKDDGQDDDPDGADKLKDPGKRALEAMKQQRQDARQARDQYRSELEDSQARVRDLEKQLRTVRAAGTAPGGQANQGGSNGTAQGNSAPQQPTQQRDADDDRPDPEQMRAQIRAEVQAETLHERLIERIGTRAAKSFADPDDAAALLLRGKDAAKQFLDDGQIDDEAIDEALKATLEKKPQYGAVQQKPRRFQGTGDGGSRPQQPTRPKSLSEAVTRRYSPTSS